MIDRLRKSKHTRWVFLVLICPVVMAIDSMSLSLQKISADQWHLEDVRLEINALNKDPQHLVAFIGKLSLPKPYDQISLVQIVCPQFSLQDNLFSCKGGQAKLQTAWLDTPEFNFSFAIEAQQKKLAMKNISIAGGRMDIDIMEENAQWQVNLRGKAILVEQLRKYIPVNTIEFVKGKLNFHWQASGQGQNIQNINANYQMLGAAMQTKDGMHACENLDLLVRFKANKENNRWLWQNEIDFVKGAVYSNPIYIEAGKVPVEFRLSGSTDADFKVLNVQKLDYKHPGVAKFQGWADLALQPEFYVQQAEVDLQVNDLKAFSNIYLQPAVTASDLEGLSFAGSLQAKVSVFEQAIQDISLSFNQLDVLDKNRRIKLLQGSGEVNWAKSERHKQISRLTWKQLEIYNMQFASSELVFLAKNNAINLLEATSLPIFDGNIRLNWFSFQSRGTQEPDVRFEGAVNQLSLAKLSAALGWKPLSGKISGAIPGVQMQQGKLDIDGELKINVFDGEVIIKQLALSGLLSKMPQLYGDVEIDNLDLQQLTSTFEFGSIEGRLSGFVRDLYMENWRPVQFYTWLGTPEEDDSRHRISQKAVNNLASIGGGGAVDLFSRGILGVFETFGYDRIGIGCYLHDGVCQLLGVEAAEQGYYIVKGGGLPRINVIGYNLRVDWQVLIERLGRL